MQASCQLCLTSCSWEWTTLVNTGGDPWNFHLLSWIPLQGCIPWDSSTLMPEWPKICFPELQGCHSAFSLVFSPQDPELCDLMVTTDEAAPALAFLKSSSLVISMRSITTAPLMISLITYVRKLLSMYCRNLQKPALLVSTMLTLQQAPLQDLSIWGYLQLSEEGLTYFFLIRSNRYPLWPHPSQPAPIH